MALPLLAVASPLKTLNPTLNPSPSRHRRRRLLSSSLLRVPPLLSRSGRLRCSAGYGDAAAQQQAAPTTPRPDEIPWSKELCNSVRLIGTVGTDVELRQLPSGASVARGRIAVWKSATETTWVTLAFWDDLAVTASEHVKQGDKIFVSGRLVSDTVEEGPEKRQVYYKVVVQEFKFIESFQPVRLYEPESSQDTQGGKHGNYVDNGFTSGSTENRKGDYMSSSSRSTEALWQAFFANPLDWWDNRKDKKNPKYPDFKHKSTGEALWVDGRSNPNWVISQLAILDSRMGSLQDKERKPVSFMYADDFMKSDANN
ncbi:protein OSB2, chloroplastic-like [Lolium rigidum]|uniref:protein OSB2, chloroplastic-like n=1 Tax=Lolium rigidum TaxID=89674 RepID=UPI001F5C4A43|nr:protein OSB2, chloroplastic-like [Lolium rigidum]